MRIDIKSALTGVKARNPGAGPRSFAPRRLRAAEGRSFADKSDGWSAETDFVNRAVTPREAAALLISPRLDRTEALAIARLLAAELCRPGLILGLKTLAPSPLVPPDTQTA